MKTVSIDNKTFKLFISEQAIEKRVKELATQINTELCNENVVFIAILNGSFMFASDLLKLINFNVQISFLKLTSYLGDKSTGNVKQLIGLNEDIEGKTVVIIEDIVDTGTTLELVKKQLIGYEPKAMKFATLLLKPDVYKGKIPIDYVGFEVPSSFLIGYGLDYDGFGRNYPAIYTVEKE